MNPRWTGVFPAITTQRTKDGSRHLDATARHVEGPLASGVDDLVMESGVMGIEGWVAGQECGLGREWVRAPRRVLQGAERKAVLASLHDGIKTRPKLSREQAPT